MIRSRWIDVAVCMQGTYRANRVLQEAFANVFPPFVNVLCSRQ